MTVTVRIWIFGTDLRTNTPEHVYTGTDLDAAYEALCSRCSVVDIEPHKDGIFDLDADFYIWLPDDSCVAVMHAPF